MTVYVYHNKVTGQWIVTPINHGKTWLNSNEDDFYFVLIETITQFGTNGIALLIDTKQEYSHSC